MKKHLIFIPLILISIGLKSQFADSTSTKYEKIYTPINNAIIEDFKNKNIKQAIVNILKANEIYEKTFSDSEKEKLDWVLNNNYYNLACAYALQGEKDNAIKAFENAVKNGYINYKQAKSDPDLESLRESPIFKELLLSIKEAGDYIYVLQQAGKYMNENPSFTYQDKSDPELVRLKEYFNLDSIAGNGDEISRVTNLLFWAHNLIRHNGSYWSDIKDMNAMNIYNHWLDTKQGVNCRWLAIFLNECYLSLGIKSRYVTCLPKNSKDNDCHVINTVYSKSLNKWIWIDPTFNAYVMDENDNMLSIAEVRQYLIDGKPLFVNQDANWNNETKQTKELYLDGYMAKNLYWLQVPLNNKAGIDRLKGRVFVSLIPLGYDDKCLKSFDYITYDENYFWENK